MFVPGKPFRPSLMSVGKAGSLAKGKAPERCFTRLARAHHSSLLRTFVNYGRKKFYKFGPGNGILGRVQNYISLNFRVFFKWDSCRYIIAEGKES